MQQTAHVGTDAASAGAGDEITCTHCGFTIDSERVWASEDNKLYTLTYGFFREYRGLVLQPVSAFC